MNIVKIDELVKKYGDFIAVDNVSLNIKEGEIFGLLGPNGAGKSTIISILCGLLNMTSGSIEIFNKNIKNNIQTIKRDLGVVPQNIALYDTFTAEENIKLFASLYGLKGRELKDSIDRALEFTGLLEFRKKKAKEFSGGMMRRLNIACAIAHNPKLIIMDEPTVGIDPQSRNHILQSVKELNRRGATIIYTTHYMEEVESLCNRIAIIDHGKVIVEGSKDELKTMVNDKNELLIVVDDIAKVRINELEKINGIVNIRIQDNNINISSNKDVTNLDKIINYCTDKNIKIIDIGYKDTTLETVFLSLTGRSLRD